MAIKSLNCGVTSNACDAVTNIANHCVETPAAAGIDAPLYWVRKGDRISDKGIRRAVVRAGGHSATVAHVNSLRGACLVQGVLAAESLAQRWPSIRITESHPKALLLVCADAKQFIAELSFRNDHERDAALGAYAALAMCHSLPGWKNWVHSEQDTFVPSAGKIDYWFPSE
jgi:hypothetical protein